MNDTIYNSKICFYKSCLDDIQSGIYKYKLMKIINSNDYNSCLELNDKIINLINTINEENILNDLQYINNNLSSLIKNYGIYNFDYFIKIIFGNEYIDKYLINNYYDKYEILKKYCHIISYKVIGWTKDIENKKLKSKQKVAICKNKIIDDKIFVEDSDILECYDTSRTSSNFNLRVYGIKVVVHDYNNIVFLYIIINNLTHHSNTCVTNV